MDHGGDIYRNRIDHDFSVSLNPAGIPTKMYDAINEGVARAGSYPDILQVSVRECIGAHEGISYECVFAGNGASELILAITRALEPENVLLTEPGFSGYRYALNGLHNCNIETYYLKKDDDFILTSDILERINNDTDLIFLCDPWNPTGKNIDEDLLWAILEKADTNDTFVVLDQSFFHLSKSCLKGFDVKSMLKRYKKLIILRSMTKLFALPGIRTGYVMADETIIKRIRNELAEWNLSAISQEVIKAGISLISESSFLDSSLGLIKKGREYLESELRSLGIRVYDSDTNFILIESKHELYEKLITKKILIRDLSKHPGLKKGFYRIAIKDQGSNRMLIESIREIINGH